MERAFAENLVRRRELGAAYPSARERKAEHHLEAEQRDRKAVDNSLPAPNGTEETCRVEPMSFDDLPKNWPDLSLRNPMLAADVVDLIVSDRDRRDNSLTFLLCDACGRLIQPVTIGRVEWGCDPAERRRTFDWLAWLPEDVSREIAGGVLALGHRQARIRQSDLAWARTAAERLEESGLELFGCFVAHSRGVQFISRPEGQVA